MQLKKRNMCLAEKDTAALIEKISEPLVKELNKVNPCSTDILNYCLAIKSLIESRNA